jgi:hypothetical protein
MPHKLDDAFEAAKELRAKHEEAGKLLDKLERGIFILRHFNLPINTKIRTSTTLTKFIVEDSTTNAVIGETPLKNIPLKYR